MTDKLKQFEQIVEVLSQDTPSTQEVADLISQIVEVVKQTKDFLERQAIENKLELNKHINRALEEALVRLDGIFTDLEKDTKNKANKAVDEAIQQTKLDLDLITKNLYVELKKLEDLIPQEADFTEVYGKIKEVESKIVPLEEIKAEKIRDKLESLEEGDKLSIQAIEDLPKILEELKKYRGVVRSGGGLSMLALNSHFIDDETPTGTVNGVNTIFTTSLIPTTGTLKVYKGGSRQRVTEDYTLSGKTVTFNTAPQVGEIILVDYRT